MFERATPRVGDSLHREPSRGAELDSEIAFFARARSRASLRIGLECLAAERLFEVAHPLLEPARLGSRYDVVVDVHSLATAILISRLQRNTRLGDSPCRRAT